MDIRAQYVIDQKLSYYKTPRFYEDTSGVRSKTGMNSIKSSKSKKLSIFDDIIKIHAKVPGPGKYSINPQTIIKQKKIRRVKQHNSKSKQTFLDHLMKRSMSLPSVGHYNINKNQYIERKEVINVKADTTKKGEEEQKKFRPTIFDIVNRDNIGISPGMYQIRQDLQRSPRYSILPQAKKQKSLPKIPSPLDYNPVPSSYSTFQKHSLLGSEQKKNSTFGSRKQQKIVQKSPGPVYNLITNWAPKKQLTSQFNIYKSISLGPISKVYNSHNN